MKYNEIAKQIRANHPIHKPDKTKLTPYQLIQNKTYTNEELITYIELEITNGKTQREIAEYLNIELTALNEYISKPQHLARVNNAYRASAEYYAGKSLTILTDMLKDDKVIDKGKVMLVKEISSRYAWFAKMRDPKKFGDKVDLTTGGETINIISLGTGIAPTTSDNNTYIDVESSTVDDE